MKTTRLLIAVLSLVPYVAVAQSTVVTLRPSPSHDLRLVGTAPSADLPMPGQPEAVPLGQAINGVVPKLCLSDLEAMALANNPALARAAARVEAARGQWIQVGLLPNPVVGYVGSEIGNEGRAGQQGAFLGQEVVRGGKLRLNRAVAAQEISAAEQQLAAQRFRVLNDVRIGFYDALIAQRRVETAQQLVGVGQRAVDTVQRLLQPGEASRVDLLQARVEVNSARIVLENARNDYLAAWRRLTAVVAMPKMTPCLLAGDVQAGISHIGFDEALHRVLTTSPEIAEAQANVLRAERAVSRARAEPVPNIDLQASAQYDNASEDTIAGVQVGIPIPIHNRNQGGIRRAEAELTAAQSNVQRIELDLQHRLASMYQRYSNAKQQVDIYTQDILPDARASFDLVTRGYQLGEFDFLTLLTSQRTYFQTNLAYLESLRQLRETSITIEGLLLTDSLRSEEPSR